MRDVPGPTPSTQVARNFSPRPHSRSSYVRASAAAPNPQQVFERRDPQPAVVDAVGRPQRGEPFGRPQRLDLRQGEVLGEPPRRRSPTHGLGRTPPGKLRTSCHIRRTRQLRLVTADQLPVTTRSGSSESTPSLAASRYEAVVCSGRSPHAPRCPTISAAGPSGLRRSRFMTRTSPLVRELETASGCLPDVNDVNAEPTASGGDGWRDICTARTSSSTPLWRSYK